MNRRNEPYEYGSERLARRAQPEWSDDALRGRHAEEGGVRGQQRDWPGDADARPWIESRTRGPSPYESASAYGRDDEARHYGSRERAAARDRGGWEPNAWDQGRHARDTSDDGFRSFQPERIWDRAPRESGQHTEAGWYGSRRGYPEEYRSAQRPAYGPAYGGDTHASAYGGRAGSGYAGTGNYGEREDFGYAGGYGNRDAFARDDTRSRDAWDSWRAGPEQQNFRGRGPKGYVRSDERLQEDISERLSDDPGIDASDISVKVKDGIVTLSGTVDKRWEKHHVENLVDRCSGVKDIENRLSVSRGGQRGTGAEQTRGDQPGESVAGSSGTPTGTNNPSPQQGATRKN